MSRLFSTLSRALPYVKRQVGTIGVAGVTLPGAVDCINKMNAWSKHYYPHHQHPNIILVQPDFSPTHEAQNIGRWDIVTDRLVNTVNTLAKAGADFAIIPANTVHIVFVDVQKQSSIPILNLLEVVANECKKNQLSKVGIMGTRWTMNEHIYKEILSIRNIKECVPTSEEQDFIQKALFSELIPTGRASNDTVKRLLEIVESLKLRGCDGIALACTELPLVLNEQNCNTVVIDTTDVLAKSAIQESVNRIQNSLDDMVAYRV